MKISSVIIAFFLLIFPGIVSNSMAGGTEVVQVADGVYAGSSKTQAGEDIYFGMERVDASNIETWDFYRTYIELFGVRSGGGALFFLARKAATDIKDFDEETRKSFGMGDEELLKFKNMLLEKGFNTRAKSKDLENIRGGVAGFNVFLSTDAMPYFVVYASKKPVVGKFPLPTKTKPKDMKEFMINYDNLIMSVGSWLTHNKDFYQNRGIFRNPFNIVEGNFKNISLQLHGFSAAVMEKFYPERKFMIVYALPSMTNILEKNLKPGDAYLGEKNIPEELKKVMPRAGGLGFEDIPIIIKTPALAKFYKE